MVKYERDALPASESDTTSTWITLTGKMNKHRTEPNSCCITHGTMRKLICWVAMQSITDIFPMMCMLMNTKTDLEDVDIDEDGPPEHLWSNIH